MALLTLLLTLQQPCFGAEPIASKVTREERAATVGVIEREDFDFAIGFNPKVSSKDVLEVQPGLHPKQMAFIPLKEGSAEVDLTGEKGEIKRRLLFKVGKELTPANLKTWELKDLKVGETATLDFTSSAAPNPQLGNKSVISAGAGASPRQIKITALKEGHSSFTIFSEDGKILRNLIVRVRK